MSSFVESCNAEEICIWLGGSKKLLSELTDQLQHWLKLQPHLPQGASRKKLEVLIVNCKLSLERAKEKLDMFYTIKTLVPEIFKNRNPCDQSILDVHSVVYLAVVPKLTPEKYRTWIMQLHNPDASKYQPFDILKYMLMAVDVLSMEEERSAFGEIYVYDLKLITLNHVLKVTPAFLKKCEIITLKAYAVRVRGIYLINVSPIVNRLMNVITSVISSKFMSKIHVLTTGNLEELYRSVPKSILPSNYGGDEPTLNELSARLRKKVDGARDWLSKEEKIVVNERLRPGSKIDPDSIFGFSGSFRKLDVD